MKQKKIPLRKCKGCSQMKSKKELVRVVKSPEGEISYDETGKKSGRGIYVCNNPECLKKCIKTKIFERELSCSVPEEVYRELERKMTNIEE